MMPKEEILDYSNEDKEIQRTLANKSEPNFDENGAETSEAGPSVNTFAKSNGMKRSPVEELIGVSSDGFVSFNDASTNPSAKKRKKLRHTMEEVRSSAAMDAQKQEQERLKRIQEREKNFEHYQSYLPVPTPAPITIIDDDDEEEDVKDIIQIDSEDDDDIIECLGVYKNQKHEVKHHGYPYRVPPPLPPGAMFPPYNQPNYPLGNYNPSYQQPPGYQNTNNASNDIPTSSYVDVHTRNVNKAREDEETRLKRQDRRNTDLESVELNAQGRLLVNHGKPDGDPDVFVAAHLTNILKPHQLGGIRFLYDNVIQSVKEYSSSPGFGCVLAHSMGLGKTLQIIGFVEIYLRTVEAKHVLIICPVNVIQNWMAEFNRWLPIRDSEGNRMRNFDVFLLGDSVKSFEDRRDMILSWRRAGGCLIMGYDMYRIYMCSENGKQNKTSESKKVLKRDPVATSADGTQKGEDMAKIKKALAYPGPDLVICDEGHKIKSLKTSVSNALNQVRTKRRIVLTGYPLQNNLLEYFCMVDFVRPHYLGTKKEFSATYDRPIKNGQCLDSTAHDIKEAQKKIHGLTSLLRGFVQRRSAHLLKKILPENKEYVIILRKTPIQHALYRAFVLYTKVDMYSQKAKYYNPLKAYSIGTKIWNHPDLLYYAYQRQRSGAVGNTVSNGKPSPSLAVNADRMRLLQTNINDYFQIFQNQPSTSSNHNTPEVIDVEDAEFFDDLGGEITYEWANEPLADYPISKIENSNKFVIAFEILKETVALGEKMLLFSSSVMTLNLLENLLRNAEVEMMDENSTKILWRRGISYSRFDGSTPASEREKLINRFNTCQAQRLFLISTKAGSLGINLVSANRVVIFDASWNPCHDAQAVCRIFRYGQQKKTFVYRLVMHNSMEKAIFYRQISKHGLQQKVVDELQVAAKVTSSQLENLLQYDESQDVITQHLNPDGWKIEDETLKKVVKKYTTLIAEPPFLHESMIFDTEDNLSEQEKIEAELFVKHEREVARRNGNAGGGGGGYGGSINIAQNGDFEAKMREYNYQNSIYRGSLRELQSGLEYSDLGLNSIQYKISNSKNASIQPQLPPIQAPMHHPIHGKNNGSLYRMNNAPVTRELKCEKSVTVIQQDITLHTYDGKLGRLFKGEQVFVMKMSGKTYLKRTTGGSEIFDATGTEYNPRNTTVIELE